MYHGEEITVKTGDYNMSFYVDGVLDASGQQLDFSIPANGTSYIVVKYDFELKDISVSVSETYVESTIENGRWQFTAYEYSNFNYDFKVDSESPTGDRYELISYDKNYGSETVSLDTYTVEYKYGTSDRTLEDLQTNNKDSFLDAVNEIAVTLSPVNHRNIFRGKNLGSVVTEEQKTTIQSGTFDDLFVGDYWEIDGVKWRIVDMDYWYRDKQNYTEPKHHLVIMPDTSLIQSYMNSENTNSSGYAGAEIRYMGLEEARTLVNVLFENMLYRISDCHVNCVFEGVSLTVAASLDYINIPSEYMIYGKAINFRPAETGVLSEMISLTQLSLFRLAPDFITDVEKPYPYWLRDATGETSFSAVLKNGTVNGYNASVKLGVRPVFAIG